MNPTPQPAEGDLIVERLQGLSFSLSVGGLDETDPNKLLDRIEQGIDLLVGPWKRDAERYRRLRGIGAAPGGSLHLRDGHVMVSTNLDAYLDDYLARGIKPAAADAVEYAPPYAPAREQNAGNNDAGSKMRPNGNTAQGKSA